MNMEISCDVASLDAELLQLAEVSPLAIKSNPDFVEKLFEQWLSLPGTNRLVRICCKLDFLGLQSSLNWGIC